MKSVITLAALLISTGVYANDVDPNGFEKEHFVSSATRAEVVSDLKIAQQQGQLPIGEIGVKFIDTPSSKSRAQVAAETREAARLGLLGYGELGPKQATIEQEQQIRLAGVRAISHSATTE